MICEYLRAGYPLLYIQTFEAERAFSFLLEEMKTEELDHLRVHIWKPHTGLYVYGTNWRLEQLADSLENAITVILRDENLTAAAADNIYVMFGVRHFLDRPSVLSGLRDAAIALRTRGSHIICIGPECDLPNELQDVMTVIEFPLPDTAQFVSLFDGLVSEYGHVLQSDIADELIERAAVAAKGLSMMQAEGAAALSIVNGRSFDTSFFDREKRAMLFQSAAIRYISHEGISFSDLGGFDLLKEHVGYRKRYFEQTSEAIKFGILSPPKGIVIIGIPGTGKSLSAKCIATELNLPLYSFDVGALFRSYVGDSEANTRRALKLAEVLSPCVLLFDEMEKMVAGLRSSGATDSGVTARVMATILAWMQDSRAPIYKIATANTLHNIDAALIRRGRWDAVFFVDVPSYPERREIFRIHLKKRGIDPDSIDLDDLVDKSRGFVGAEIESAIDEALFRAFSQRRVLTSKSIRDILRSVVPITETNREEIQEFRRWLRGRAQPVSSVT